MSADLPSPRTRLLVALCAVLSLIVVAELVVPLGFDRPFPVSPVQVTPAADLAALGQAQTALPSLESLSETRRRPIFIATRQAAQASTTGAAAGDGLILGRYRLMGVVITPTRRSVVVKPARGGATTELRVGSTIDGWTVDAIAPEFMKLKSGANEETISLVPKRRK